MLIYVSKLAYLMNKQSRCRWFYNPCHLCYATGMVSLPTKLQLNQIFALQGSKLPLDTQCMLFYFFAIDLQIYQVQKMLPEIAHSSLVHYFDMVRKVIINSYHNTKMGGQVDGFKNVIEIDESLFGKKQKYVRGRTTKKQWVFGLVERGTRKTFFKSVSDRTRQTLLPIIESKAQRGYCVRLSVCRNAGELLPILNITTQCCIAGVSPCPWNTFAVCRIVGCRHLSLICRIWFIVPDCRLAVMLGCCNSWHNNPMLYCWIVGRSVSPCVTS